MAFIQFSESEKVLAFAAQYAREHRNDYRDN